MIECQSVETGGRRCVHVAGYTLRVKGDDDPQPRIMLSSGWIDDPAFPVGEQCITLPVSALPALIAALEEMQPPHARATPPFKT